MSTAAALLAEVEAAISTTLVSQSYSAPGGRTKQMAYLATLSKFRRELIEEMSAGSGSGGSMASLCQMEGAR